MDKEYYYTKYRLFYTSDKPLKIRKAKEITFQEKNWLMHAFRFSGTNVMDKYYKDGKLYKSYSDVSFDHWYLVEINKQFYKMPSTARWYGSNIKEVTFNVYFYSKIENFFQGPLERYIK